MHNFICGTLGALALLTCASSLQAGATAQRPEFALMQRTMTVTLLNEGGKYVVVDMKHIPQGGTCRVDKDAIMARVGPGSKPGTTRVRYVGIQVSTGGCPFLTTFDMADSDYAAARDAFLQMRDKATEKVDQVRKDLGRTWHDIVGDKN